MSEKRFECVFIEDDEFGGTFRRLKDNETGIVHMTCDVVDLLNFQNTQIKCLKEENEQLREINKEIGDDLHNCRLNKNIIREKLKQWQEVHKEYNIYSIKGFEDLLDGLSKENEELKQELKGMDELLQSYQKTIKHDAELLADASKKGYLPPLNDYLSNGGWICGCCKHFHSSIRDRCDKDNNWVLTDEICQDFER